MSFARPSCIRKRDGLTGQSVQRKQPSLTKSSPDFSIDCEDRFPVDAFSIQRRVPRVSGGIKNLWRQEMFRFKKGNLFESQGRGNFVQTDKRPLNIASEGFNAIFASILRIKQWRRTCKICLTKRERNTKPVPAPAFPKTSIGNGKQIERFTGSLDQVGHSLFRFIDRSFGTIGSKNERSASVFGKLQQLPQRLNAPIA